MSERDRATVGGYPSSDRPASDLRPPPPGPGVGPRSSADRDDNPHESDGTHPEACTYCGDVWPCVSSGCSDPSIFPRMSLLPWRKRR